MYVPKLKLLSLPFAVASIFALSSCVGEKKNEPTVEKTVEQTTEETTKRTTPMKEEGTPQEYSEDSGIELVMVDSEQEQAPPPISFDVPSTVLEDAENMFGGRVVQAAGSQQGKVDTWTVIVNTENGNRVQSDFFRFNDQVFTIEGDGNLPNEQFSKKLGLVPLLKATKVAIDTIGGSLESWKVKNTGASGWYYIITLSQPNGTPKSVKIHGSDAVVLAVQAPEIRKNTFQSDTK